MEAAEKIVSKMTLDQKIGQLFTLGFCGTTMTPEARDMILDLQVGGLRVTPNVYIDFAAYRKMVREAGKGDVVPRLSPFVSPENFAGLLNRFQEMAAGRDQGIPLHISVDVSNLSRGGYPFFPSPMGFTCAGDRDLFRACMETYAGCMRATGVNMVHYPCVDVVRQPESPEINTGSFSSDPAVVGEYGALMVEAFASRGVIATGKHFPGRGYSTMDAHYTVDICERSAEELSGIDLEPYRRMIARGLPAIMTAHSSYPHLAGDSDPATISKGILRTVIREKLGFRGVVTTDSITMEGIRKLMPTHEACARAIEAGGDLVLYKTLSPEDAALAMRTVRERVEDGRIPVERIDESVGRVIAMKIRSGLMDGGWKADPGAVAGRLEESRQSGLARRAAREAALLIRDRRGLLPVQAGRKILVVEQCMFTPLYTNDEHYHPYMLWEEVEKRYPGSGLVRLEFFGNEGKLEEIREKIAAYDLVVATNHYSRGAGTNTEFLDKVSELAGDRMIVVTDSPFPAVVSGKMGTVICLFSEAPESLGAAVETMAGDLEPKNRMPVDYLGY